LITQSDPGSKNYGVANAHTMTHHRLDPSLSNTLQYRWMQKKQHIKSEANWSIFHHDFTSKFENIFDMDVNSKWYNINNPLE